MKIFVEKKQVKKISGYQYSSTQKNNLVPRNKRILLLMILFFIAGGLIIFKLIQLQLISGNYYAALASDRHEIFEQLSPIRGEIFAQEKDINGQYSLYPLAINSELNFVYAVPKDIEDPEAVLNVLMEVLDFSDEIKANKKETVVELSVELNMEEELIHKEEQENLAIEEAENIFKQKLLEKLSKDNDPFEPIKRRVTEDKIAKLQEFNLTGIKWVKEPARFYPDGSYGSHLVGFVGHGSENNLLQGYYGVEGNYNKELMGEAGFIRSESDTTGNWIAFTNREFREAKDGSDIVLTIDQPIQNFACEQLFYGIKNNEADSGSLIVMNPKTGAILAMCSYPDFDPNNYNKVTEVGVFNNPALLAAYEPGSIFKPITMAAALDAGKVTPYTGYNDTGVVSVSGFDIKNSDLQAHGWKTMTEVLELSLNTGTIFAARQVGLEKFREYVKAFGFGEKSGIDLSPEASGNIKSLDNKNEVYLATASFGQGITTTPIQLVKAFAAIANKGNLPIPYVVDKIIYPDGTEKKNEPKIVGQVISVQTAEILGSMLVSVVENGHSQRAKASGYLIAGKTGTAQVADTQKGGYGDLTIHSFIGYGPYEDPVFVMLVKLDHVRTARFAESSAAPIFGKVAKFILDYYGIPPTIK